MKKLLYLFTILLLLCSSCRTKQAIQEYSLHSDSTRTECSTNKEMVKEENRTTRQMAISDTMSASIIEEEFTIKFDTMGRPTEFHGKKKKSEMLSKSEKNSSLDKQFADEKLSFDSNYELVNIEHYKYNKKVQPEKKSSKNVLFAVMLSLLTLIICHCVLKRKIKQKKLGA